MKHETQSNPGMGALVDSVLPCPFCGSSEIKFLGIADDTHAWCTDCGATGPLVGECSEPFDYEGEATRLWSKRTDMVTGQVVGPRR